MTCREKLALEHPECIAPNEKGGCWDCPITYGYLTRPEYCEMRSSDVCYKCWDREIPEETNEEKPMSTKKTKAELMEELEAANKAKADLEKQLAEMEKYKNYRNCGDELKAIHIAFMDAGFDSTQAFTLLQTMMMNSMAENLTRDLRKTVRR